MRCTKCKLNYCRCYLSARKQNSIFDDKEKEKKDMQYFCNICKEKFSTEFQHETHPCKPPGKSTWWGLFNIVKCETCGLKMSLDLLKPHKCKWKEETMTNPEARMQIAVFVSPRRVDTMSMRLAATEFPNANFIVRGIEAEEPFTKIAKEMKSSITQAAAGNVPDLDAQMLRRSDISIMFPSKHTYSGNQILKFPVTLGDFKIPVIVYPER